MKQAKEVKSSVI